LSLIFLPSIKEYWNRLSKSRSTLWTLLAIILAMHLKTVLQQEIVLKFLTWVRLGTLGIKAIEVALSCLSNRLEIRKEWTTLRLSRLIMLQVLLKKPILNPFGLRTLLSLRERKTFWISSSLIRLSRVMIWDEDNC